MYFNLQPTLENELVFLRPLKKEDYESLYQAAKDPLIWEQHSADRYKKKEYDAFFKDSLGSRGALVVLEKESKEIIGSSRFKKIEGAESAVEIGWSFLSRKYWGGKYNQSVKTLMMNYAFQSVEDIIFYIARENIRSQKAVEKIGGVRITKPEYRHLMKKKDQGYTYRINKNDWK